jgi:hypothetical protein
MSGGPKRLWCGRTGAAGHLAPQVVDSWVLSGLLEKIHIRFKTPLTA